ncbi:hypothetical protein PGB90_004862 [Kerria lacca]
MKKSDRIEKRVFVGVYRIEKETFRKYEFRSFEKLCEKSRSYAKLTIRICVDYFHVWLDKSLVAKIFVVRRSADSYAHYISMMPWFTIPYEDNASRSQLTTLFGIQGIPSLILLNPDGSVITEDGRGEVNDDPEGTNFPWFPKPVNILTPRLATKLQKKPAIVLFIDSEEDGEIELATAVLAPISECVQKKYQETLLFLIATDVSIHFILEDVSPLLTLIDISLGRFTIMEYGKEITEQNIMNFVNRFYNNELLFLPIERSI